MYIFHTCIILSTKNLIREREHKYKNTSVQYIVRTRSTEYDSIKIVSRNFHDPCQYTICSKAKVSTLRISQSVSLQIT